MVGYIKSLFAIIVGLSVFFFIILKNFDKLNQLKSQSLALVKKTEIDYEMNLETLPIHYFSEFSKIDVTNRMACMIDSNWEACKHFCDIRTKNEELTDRETWNCYEYFNISKSHYGLDQCKTLFPVITKDNGVQYFNCIKQNNVNYT